MSRLADLLVTRSGSPGWNFARSASVLHGQSCGKNSVQGFSMLNGCCICWHPHGSTCSQHSVNGTHLLWACGVHTCTLTCLSLLFSLSCLEWSLGCHIITDLVVTSHLGFTGPPKTFPSRRSFCHLCDHLVNPIILQSCCVVGPPHLRSKHSLQGDHFTICVTVLSIQFFSIVLCC